MYKIRKVALVLLALCLTAFVAAGGASAKPHAGSGAKKPKKSTAARLDPSFGRGGVARIATSRPEGAVRMALAPNGRVYVLQTPMLLAFEPDGKPARSFGNNGRVRVVSGESPAFLENLTVDSQGRVLVVGPSTHAASEALVIRFLEDGSEDPSFGSGGEVDTNFGLPSPGGASASGTMNTTPVVTATKIAVDSQDRVIVGGSYAKAIFDCGYSSDVPASYTARLDASGAIDTSYGDHGYAITGSNGTVSALAETPEGGAVTISTGHYCGGKEFSNPSTFDSVTESGAASPALDPARPAQYALPEIAVDGQGRSLLIQAAGVVQEEPFTLVRLLPSGLFDPSFGSGGGTPLIESTVTPDVLAVDGQDRALVAGGEGAPVIYRYTTAGKRDGHFGHRGVLTGGGEGDEEGRIDAIAVGPHGSIYTAGWIKNASLKTGAGIQITRFLPGS